MENLADYHIHLGYGDFRRENRSAKYANTDLDSAYNNLLQYQGTGITYLRDGGDKNMRAFRLKGEAQELGITLAASGRALVRRGHYGKHLGYAVDTMAELKAELNFLFQSQVDCIKVVQSNIVAVNGEPQDETPSFNLAMLQYIVAQAHDRGLPVMVHVNFPGPIALALEAGVDTVEHGYFITPELLQAMAEKGVAWTPTLAPFANALTYDVWIPGWQREIVKSVVAQQRLMVEQAVALGVRVLPGSDGGSSICPHSRCTLDEHRLLNQIPGFQPGPIYHCYG